MKRLLVGALLAAIAAAVPASDLSMRKLLEMAKANSESRVLVIHLRGDDWAGKLTEIGSDVFCVAADPLPDGVKRPEHCYATSSVTKVVRIGTGGHDRFTTIWVSGPG